MRSNTSNVPFFLQPNEPGGGAEGDPAAGGRRRALHRHSRGVATEAAQARQHRHPPRHHPHPGDPHLRLWVRGKYKQSLTRVIHKVLTEFRTWSTSCGIYCLPVGSIISVLFDSQKIGRFSELRFGPSILCFLLSSRKSPVMSLICSGKNRFFFYCCLLWVPED